MSVFGSQSDRNGAARPFSSEFTYAGPQPPLPTPPRPAPEPAARKASVLGKTLVFRGELEADEDLILQGRVEGSIRHTQSITVGVDGSVIGDIHAASIVVEGTVEGNLHGSVSVIVGATAKVTGNIVAPRVGITEGAQFNGSVDMKNVPTAAARDSTPKESPVMSDQVVDRILQQS